MKKFQIEIEEILQHVYEIEAETLESAIDIAGERYRKEEYILSPEDLKETNISEYEEEKIRDKKQKSIESR